MDLERVRKRPRDRHIWVSVWHLSSYKWMTVSHEEIAPPPQSCPDHTAEFVGHRILWRLVFVLCVFVSAGCICCWLAMELNQIQFRIIPKSSKAAFLKVCSRCSSVQINFWLEPCSPFVCKFIFRLQFVGLFWTNWLTIYTWINYVLFVGWLYFVCIHEMVIINWNLKSIFHNFSLTRGRRARRLRG